MKVAPHSRLLMIGDSITAAGRSPDGEAGPGGAAPGFGSGYVGLVAAALEAFRPADRIRVINKGVGGNTVLDLQGRWQQDVLDLDSGWVSVMIGINDVWRQFDVPLQTHRHVPLPVFRETLDGLLATLEGTVKGLVCLTPYFIEPNRQDPMRSRMDEVGRAVRELARSRGSLLVDTQDTFDRLCGALHPAALAWDRLHTSRTGHMALADAFLRAVGFAWPQDRPV